MRAAVADFVPTFTSSYSGETLVPPASPREHVSTQWTTTTRSTVSPARATREDPAGSRAGRLPRPVATPSGRAANGAPRGIPEATVARLPVYLRALVNLTER